MRTRAWDCDRRREDREGRLVARSSWQKCPVIRMGMSTVPMAKRERKIGLG
jgi:hypothetical protein